VHKRASGARVKRGFVGDGRVCMCSDSIREVIVVVEVVVMVMTLHLLVHNGYHDINTRVYGLGQAFLNQESTAATLLPIHTKSLASEFDCFVVTSFCVFVYP
jgi:hypothetical protein